MEDTTSTTTDTSTAVTGSTATTQDTTAQTQTPETTAPRSFDEAVEQLKAQDEAASTDREPATTAQETSPPVTTDKPPASKQGPIPFKVHETALANARDKAVAEAKPQIEAEVKQRYAWAEEIEEPDREELRALYHGLKTDLMGTLTTLIDNASKHPDHAKALRSQAARLLNAARRVQGEESTGTDEPQPDIPLEDGRAVYSADQQRKRDAWLIKQVSAHFDQQLEPFKADREKAQQAAQMTAIQQRASDVLKTYSDKPHFAEHKADILALMQAHQDWTLGDAYAEVLATKVLPGATDKGRATALADIHHKAGAGTLSPQQTTTAFPIKPDGRFTTDRIRAFFEETA